MRVTLSPAFDGGAWRASPPPGAASLDAPVVGLAGFLQLLEAQLGLAAVEAPFSARVVATAAAARALDAAFFSPSCAVDSIGVARCLVEARDELVWEGLDPNGPVAALPARVADVVRATAEIPTGSADRVRAIHSLLERGDATGAPLVRVPITDLVVDGEDELPALWRAVVASLRRRGTRVSALSIPAAPATGDLHGARSAPFIPTGDGSIVLFRPESVDAAAEDVAASLAAHARTVATLVIGADSSLDTALARRGAPTIGAAAAEGEDELLEVLPVVLSVGLGSRDPTRVLELLSLSLGPVPRAIARKLTRVLMRAPSTHGQAFGDALAEALAALDEPGQSRIRLRLLELLREDEIEGGIRVDDLRRRIRLVKGWLGARAAARNEDGNAELFVPALTQASILEQMIDAGGGDASTRIAVEELRRLVDEATRRTPRRAREPAKAGLVAVQDPGAVTAPIARTIWWGFTRRSAELPRAPIVWSRAERHALSRAGVTLMGPVARARSQAQRHARPLACTTGELVLVCPRVDRRGDEMHPHPLWDEIAGRAAASGVGSLVRRRLDGMFSASRVVVHARALPVAREHWPVPAAVARALESPTSMERLLGCPLHFVLDTWALKPQSTTLPEGSKLFGLVAHEVLARTLREGDCTPHEAETRARRHFPEVVREQADAYALTRHAFRRRAAAEAIARAAQGLSQWLLDNRRRVVAVEERVEVERAGRKMGGTPDLVVGTPLVVIDFKTGSERLHEDKLMFGTAVQLAYYSYLLRERDRATNEDAPWPPVAYYQIGSARMLAVEGTALAHTDLVRGLPPAQTMVRVRDQAKERFDAIAAGVAHAPGAFGDPEQDEDAVPPPCRICPHDLLCGRALRERERA